MADTIGGRDFDARPYSEDEARVARFFMDEVGIGGGEDPIGAILASHVELARQRNLFKARLRAAGLSDDAWEDEYASSAPDA